MNQEPFSKMSYGVYIVASGNKDKKNAFVATAVFQVTAIPEKIAVVCHKDNFSCHFIEELQVFGLSVIQRNYTPSVLGKFGFRSGRDINKFQDTNYFYGESTGCPIIADECLAWFECIVEQTVDVGSHLLFIGKVADCGMLDKEAEPLTYEYYHKVKNGLTPKNAPSHQQK